MYAIVRNDIEMSHGKRIAQAGHAFVNSALNTPKKRLDEYQGTEGIGTKVTLQANLQQIEELHYYAERAGIPCSLIVDSGHIEPPHFDGSPIVTALGISPIMKREFPILSKLKTYRG